MAAPSFSGPQLERRAHRRIDVRIPVVVRTASPDGATLEESTHSVNISRMGAAFAARIPLEVGRVVEVTIPAPGPRREPAKDFFTRARVVRIEAAPPAALTPTTAATFEAALSTGPSTSALNPPRVGSPVPAEFPSALPSAFGPAALSSGSSARIIAVEFIGQQYPHVFVSESTT